MLTSENVYLTLLNVAREDIRGNSLSVEEFNRVAPMVNEDIYSDYQKDKKIDFFRVFNTAITLTAGKGSMPSNYSELIGEPRVIETLSGISYTRKVDTLTPTEYTERLSDYLTQPTSKYPVCIMGGNSVAGALQINLTPTTISTMYIDYVRTPSIPVLDYYIDDTTFEKTFMAMGATPTVPALHTTMNGTVGPVVNFPSTTIDFEWDLSDLSLIIAKFIRILGLSLPDEMMIQVGNADEQKILSK